MPTPPSVEVEPVDRFYAIDRLTASAARGESLAVIALERKLREHLAAAVLGSRERESRLVNRIGQIRRSVPRMSLLDPAIKQILKEAKEWLAAVGRVIDLGSDDPREWISQRGGQPRW